MKNRKRKNRGFVLVETLIVSVFVMVILSIMYRNFYPLMSEYEKRENYDDIDSKYETYWIKNFIQDVDYATGNYFESLFLAKLPYVEFSCDYFVDSASKKKEQCKRFLNESDVAMYDGKPKIFITSYRIGSKTQTTNSKDDNSGIWSSTEVDSTNPDFKNFLDSDESKEGDNAKRFDSFFREYVENLPDYQTESLNNAYYRVIVQFERKPSSGSNGDENYYTFATFEVKKAMYAGEDASKLYRTATFHPNPFLGTYASPPVIRKEANELLGTLPTISRSGYHFEGWFANKEETDVNKRLKPDESRMPGEDVTYYAKWTPLTYNIYYLLHGGCTGTDPIDTITAFNPPLPASAQYDSVVTIPNLTKKIKIVYKNEVGATLSGGDKDPDKNFKIKDYTFQYWDIYHMTNSEHYFGTTKSTAEKSTKRKEERYKNLSNKGIEDGGWVVFDAYFTSPTFTLPKITKTGHYCRWYSGSHKARSSSGEMVVKNDVTLVVTGNGTGTYTPEQAKPDLISPIVNPYGDNPFGGENPTGPNERTFEVQCFPNSYKITLDKQGGTGGTSTIYEYYGVDWYSVSATGTPPVAPANDKKITSVGKPSKTGYLFGGYYTQKSCKGTQIIQNNGNMVNNKTTTFSDVGTLYACWSAQTSTVSFDVNGGTGGQSASVTATYGTAMPAINTTAPTRTGYTFGGWYDTAASSGGTQYYTAAGASARNWDKASATTLYARWTAKKYTISFNVNGGTGGQSASVTATYGTAMPAINTTAPTKTGYTFGGWYDTAASSGGTQYYTVAGASSRNWDKASDTTLYARWIVIRNYKVGSTFYGTLNDAINGCAKTGSTIEVQQNCTDSTSVSITTSQLTSVTLNTNGKTITRGSSSLIVGSGVILSITGSGTIKGSSAITNSGTLNVTSATLKKTSSAEVIINSGTLTINSGVVSSAGNCIVSNSNGTINIKGGTLTTTGSKTYGIKNYGTGIVNISGGIVQVKGDGYVAISNYANGTISMTGGTIDGGVVATGNNTTGLMNEANTGTITVTGGAINVTDYAIAHRGGVITVSGGTVNSLKYCAIMKYGGTSKPSIQGGTLLYNKNYQPVCGDYTAKSGCHLTTGTYNSTQNKAYLVAN